jgi:transposase-like protein
MDKPADAAVPFTPPFCPNPICKYHHLCQPDWPWKRHGFYRRLTAPHRIQRFTCRHCRRAFSSQTFHTSYWLKRADLLSQLLLKIVGGMASRQIARDLHAAPSTIDRQLARLGRHCLLLHSHLTSQAQPQGDLVLDGFESFEYSQFYPFVHHLLVEAQTSFFWHFTDSPLRRKGRMTPAQKCRRRQLEQRLGRPDPKAVEHDVHHLLDTSLPQQTTVTLRSDDHPAYPRAWRRLPCQVRHQITPSQRRRDADNPLFEINLLDLLIRHSQANHRRETIAWSKRRQGSAERLAVLLVWRNYVKYRWEKRCRQTPAMLKGLLSRPWKVADVLRERLFRTRVALPGRWDEYYRRAVVTVPLPINRRHTLSYAY